MPSPATTLLLVTVLGLLAGLLVIILALLLERGPEGRFKRARYEAGNIPSGEAKTRLPFQYYGYVILYLGVEPLIVLLYLLPFSHSYNSLITLASLLAVLLPVIAWGVAMSEKINEWRI
ncbi:NADH-quinone oxidoreductase subunit A [Infirmifilum lucidum]|uniref:NADH-quinone oxidoreductase subunit A n=1 Tax=Infirmifilum lucidum TaxID=2776706 RepID=A0A7L9FJY6_9CREN|nr:NADH-quinone oxidoreductase subunit A [Infirmifilum lucidum]QOJ79323.1 NADH-quinone oxidoreductase subunit A [Infirmifilum lucidum]